MCIRDRFLCCVEVFLGSVNVFVTMLGAVKYGPQCYEVRALTYEVRAPAALRNETVTKPQPSKDKKNATGRPYQMKSEGADKTITMSEHATQLNDRTSMLTENNVC